MTRAVLPGASIGILGSGQLGRMFAIAAKRMGYRVYVFSPESGTPAGQVADVEIAAPYDDLDSVATFAQQVEVVSFEFENIPLPTVQQVEQFAPVRPSGQILHTTQNRLREKTFLRNAGLPVTPFFAIHSEDDLDSIPEDLIPGVLKTAAWGYDGRGQARVTTREELARIWKDEMQQDAILEKWVDFSMELSVVAVRGGDGSTAFYDPVENQHRHHILDVSLSPARISPEVAAEAIKIAREIVTRLELVGVLCIEMFLGSDGTLVVNELAPRPHNSGHLTIDAHLTCQFEQQVRSICGLPLGSTRAFRPAAMANLLGNVWANGVPNWEAACAFPEVKLHLYGKSDPRPRRKMGHLTATADSCEAAAELVTQARDLLCPRDS